MFLGGFEFWYIVFGIFVVRVYVLFLVWCGGVCDGMEEIYKRVAEAVIWVQRELYLYGEGILLRVVGSRVRCLSDGRLFAFQNWGLQLPIVGGSGLLRLLCIFFIECCIENWIFILFEENGLFWVN